MPIYPLLRQPLGLGDLFGSQPLLDRVLVRPCSFISLRCGERKPHEGEDQVLLDQSEVGRGQRIPLRSLRFIPIPALGVNHPKVGLG